MNVDQTFEDRKKCPYCAEFVQIAAIKCRFCGSSLTDNVAHTGASAEPRLAATSIDAGRQIQFLANQKSGFAAAVLNLVLPGAGYAYCGRVILGVFVFVFTIIVGIITVGFGMIVLGPVFFIDGFLCAGRANRKLAQKLTAGAE